MKKSIKLLLFPYIIICYEIAVYLSNDMYLPAMPAIAKDLMLTESQIQYTLILWFLGASSLQLILGPISDRFGRKNVLVGGGILFVLSSAVCAHTSQLWIMLLARFVQGTAICALVAAYAAVHELFNTKQSIKLLALIGAVTILAPAFGPLVGALTVQFADWRYIFWFLVVFGSISLIGIILFMPDNANTGHPLKFKQIVSGYKNILCNKDYMLPNLSYSFLVAIFFFWIFESPFLFIVKQNKSTLYYGISQTFIFSCFIFGAWLTKVLLMRHSVNKLIEIGTVMTIIGNIMLVVGSWYSTDLNFAVISMMVVSTGTSLLFGPINRIAIEASNEPMGRRTAVFSTIVSLFGALCGWFLTVINTSSLFTISVLILACTIAASLLIMFTKIPLQFEEDDEIEPMKI